MRSSKSRSRNKNRNQRSLGNVVNRVFDSSGPEGKVRGTPQQIIEKYLALARDAQLSGDRVAEQSFLQHAEHYTRMLGEAQREQAERQAQFGGQPGFTEDRDGEGRRDEYRNEQQRNDQQRYDQQRNGEGRSDQPRADHQRGEQQRGEPRRDDGRRDGRGERDSRREDRRDDRGERESRRDDRRERPAPQPEAAAAAVDPDMLPDFLKAAPAAQQGAAVMDEPAASPPEAHDDQSADADAAPQPQDEAAAQVSSDQAPRQRRRRTAAADADAPAAPRRAPRKRSDAVAETPATGD